MAEVTPASGVPLEERKRMLDAYLSFDALENPTWRKNEEVTVNEMLTQIMKYQKEWEEKKDQYEPKLVQKVYQEFIVDYISHVLKEEEKGFSTFEETDDFLSRCSNLERSHFSIKELETINLKNAYEYLLDKIKREESPGDYGLMEAGLLQETHKILMKDIPLPKINSTKHGEFSNKKRKTEFKGEEYFYQKPSDMQDAVMKLLDRINIMFDRCTKDGLKDFSDLYNLFKTCAWMLMELLDLHPFADGNGRLCRMLCSYMLSKYTPFPTPVYNVWTDSCKDDYMQGLVDARKYERHPTALTTMVIECNYHGWRKFFEALDEKKKSQGKAVQEMTVN